MRMDAPERSHSTVLLATLTALLGMAFVLAKTGRDSLFIQSAGVENLPFAYFSIAAATFPAAYSYVKLIELFGAHLARSVLLLLTVAVQIFFATTLRSATSSVLIVFFASIPTLYGLLFASLWLLTTHYFRETPKSETAVQFSRIGAAALAGGLLGGLLAKTLARSVDPDWLVFLSGLVLLPVLVILQYFRLRSGERSSAKSLPQRKERPSIYAALRSPYTHKLLLISVVAALAAVLIDFQFFITATDPSISIKGKTDFFATLYTLLHLSSLLLQLLLAPRIQTRFGLRAGLAILPLALLGVSAFAGTMAAVLSRSLLKLTEGGIKASIHRSLWEQVFLPLTEEERSPVKILVDGIGIRFGEMIGAGIMLMWLHWKLPDGSLIAVTQWVAFGVFLLCLFWLRLTTTIPPPPDPAASRDFCPRFPDQCPCATEMAKRD
ncbi:hypothetical protein L0222_15755 [bacterium]|nr:hypothetical protein [bacterium]